MQAIGSNQEAVRLSGIRVGWYVFAVYVISGGLSALAGMVEAARSGVGSPVIGIGMELDVKEFKEFKEYEEYERAKRPAFLLPDSDSSLLSSNSLYSLNSLYSYSNLLPCPQTKISFWLSI